VAPESNTNTKNKRFSSVDFWLINRLKKEGSPVVLPILVADYAKERDISEPNARDILRRRLKRLEQQGIIERLDTYPVSYKLKRLPLEFFAQISRLPEALDDGFDLSQSSRVSPSLEKSLVVLKKNSDPRQLIEILRKMGLRVITRANSYRQKGLLIAQYKPAIKPGSTEHADIAFLYRECIRWWENSVIVFYNDFGQFIYDDVSTRFTDEKRAKWNYLKSRMALKIAFRRHKDALMITVTVPHIFPLVVPIEVNGKIIGFIPLQDSIISELKNYMIDWLRQIWKGRKIETFTAYEYHKDYNLHLHILIFGIPYLIEWTRKFGKKKEDALTYYSRKYGISFPPDVEKSQISKHIFTALLDKWLMKILIRFGSALQINLLEAYINYKKKHNLQGPVNEIHRIKDGKWDGSPPNDAIISYSSGAAYRKVLSPDDYVTKYLLKIYNMVSGGGGGIDEENQAKVYGYWLFGKRFNSYSRSLLPQKKKPPKLPYWHLVGVFNKLDIPDWVMNGLVSW